MKRLESTTFYDCLTPSQKALYDRSVRIERYLRGELVHSHSGDCLGIIRVISGVISVNMLSDEGREISLFRIREGESFVLSAMCVLKNVSFESNIEAESDTTLEILSAHVLSNIIEENKDAECYLYRLAASRFSNIIIKLQRVVFGSLESRLAEFLLKECEYSGRVKLEFTHEQIAKNIASSREPVTRMLKRFSDEGLVILGRGSITIADKSTLAELCGAK